MAAKFKHPEYLSEQQVCDQLEAIFKEDCFNSEVKREFLIGSAKPDFAIFHSNFIEIIEVKLAADISAVRQIAFYKRVLETSMLLQAIDTGIVSVKYPEVRLCIAAKIFDSEILDLMDVFGIVPYQYKITKNKTVEFVIEKFPEFTVNNDREFRSLVASKYLGVTNV